MPFATLALVLIAASLTCETLGIYLRAIGATRQRPTIGYSAHLRIATLGRFSTTLGAPLLGTLVDSGRDQLVFWVAGLSCLLTVLLIVLLAGLTARHGYRVFDWMNGGAILPALEVKCEFGILGQQRFFIMTLVSFLIYSQAIFIVNILALYFPAHRATVVQFSALFSAAGTMLHVLFVDPHLAQAADDDPDRLNKLCNAYVFARILVLSFAGTIFGIFAWLL